MVVSTRTVGVRDAKARLSEILREVGRGTEWVVTDRGRPVARIVPLEPTSLPLNERLRRMEERGLLGPRRGAGELPPPLPLPEGRAQFLLDEDRGQ